MQIVVCLEEIAHRQSCNTADCVAFIYMQISCQFAVVDMKFSIQILNQEGTIKSELF